MYTLKPPLETKCLQCQKKLIVNFCPPSQKYSNKNHWGYWTDQKENESKYKCDACLIDLYRHHKLVYLDSITDSRKRRTFRAYFGGKVSLLLTKTQQQELERDELTERLRKRGVNLAEEGLGEWLESWRQNMLKLIEENSRKEKRIKELEKRLAKSQRKPFGKSKS